MTTLLERAALDVQERLQRMAARPEGLTVRELVERYMARYTGRDGSIVQRLSTWQAMIGSLTLETVDGDVLRAARATLQEQPALSFKGVDADDRKIFKSKARQCTKSVATINRYMAAISSVFSWAIEERLTPRGWTNPCRGIRQLREPRGRVRFLDAAELERLLAACKESRYKRLHALVLAALCTGARRGELLGLRCGDLDLDAGVALLGDTKNGDARVLVLLEQVVTALRPLISSDPARFVFGSPRTRFQTPANIGTAWRRALARAGIGDFRFHDLRHSCASYLSQNGVDMNVIREILGHRRLEMTMRYAHLNVGARATAMRAALGRIGT